MAKILVVDDAEHIREYYGKIFEKHFPGYVVSGAEDNDTALARSRDIALLTTNQRRRNWRERGSDLVWELRNEGATYPILMISASYPSELKQEGMVKIGVSAVLWIMDVVHDEARFVRMVREFLEQGNSPTYEAYAAKAR